MRWPIMVLFLLSACARGPTEAEHMDTCAKLDSPAAECDRGVAAGVGYDRAGALQQPGQVRQQNDALSLQPRR